MANGRTGQVFLENFDVGLARTLGGELIEIQLDGESVQSYAVRIEGVPGPADYQGLIPILFNPPEDVYERNLLPQIVIGRAALTTAMERWLNPFGREYMVPAAGSKTVTNSRGQSGPDKVEIKYSYAAPFDIDYDVHLRTKLRSHGDTMLAFMLGILWPDGPGQLRLTDSEGEERGYYAFINAVQPLDDIGDISDRMMGHLISLRVEGELDVRKPSVHRTAREVSVSVSKKV